MSPIFFYPSIAVSGLLLLALMWRWPNWVALLTIAATGLLDCLEVGTSGLSAGVTFYVDDAAGAILLLVAIVVLLRNRKGIPRHAILPLILLGLVALDFSRGISVFGLKPAGNSARNLFMFTAPAAALMLLRPALRLDAGRLARWLCWAGYGLSAIAILRWMGVLAVPLDLADTTRDLVRTLPPDHAFPVGLAFIAAVYHRTASRLTVPWWVAAGFFGAMTIFLQYRSVWVATAGGIGWLTFRNARASARRWFFVGIVGALVLGVVALALPEIKDQVGLVVTANIHELQEDNSTWMWRVHGYEEAIYRFLASDITDTLVGPAAGWAANSDASFASTHIHSRYLDTLAYYGIVGLAALLLWFGILWSVIRQPLRQTWGSHGSNPPGQTLLEALLVAELVYLVPYFGGILEGAVLGLIWVAASQKLFRAARPIVLRDFGLRQMNKVHLPELEASVVYDRSPY